MLQSQRSVATVADEHERILLTILSELRNIQTHNRGVVNRLFLNRVGRSTYEDFEFVWGQAYVVPLTRFATLARNAIDIAVRLDQRLVAKFGLEVVAFPDSSND